MNELTFHEVADIFPLMEGEDFRGLVEDIRKFGLKNPIVLHQGKIIDGRNRYLACREAGIEPRSEEWDGKGSLVDYVVSLNLKRRQLNETQRGVVAAKLENLKQGRPEKGSKDLFISREAAARLLNVSEATVKRASGVLKRGVPELVEAVEKGEIKAAPAYKIAKLPQEEQRQVIEGGRVEIKAPKSNPSPGDEKPQPQKITKKQVEEAFNGIVIAINDFGAAAGRYKHMGEVLDGLTQMQVIAIRKEMQYLDEWVTEMLKVLPKLDKVYVLERRRSVEW